jgi:hypothetical protein
MATLRYLFSIDCENLVSEYAGELPAGSRVHVRYGDGKLSTDNAEYQKDWIGPLKDSSIPGGSAVGDALSGLENPDARAKEIAKLKLNGELPKELNGLWAGLDGDVLRGIDWALVRKDGVVVFDGRVTLRASEQDHKNGFLIDALITGAVDLAPPEDQTPEGGSATYYRWKAGSLKDKVIKVALGVRFEASGEAPPDASEDYKRKVKNFPRYMRLTRHQCSGFGELTLGVGKDSNPIEKLLLKVYENDT